MTVRQSIRHMVPKAKHCLATLNVFPSESPSTDEYELRTQRLATRLFFFIFTISLVLLLLYTSMITVGKTITVKEPSFAQYSHINSTYSQTLTCPCSKISTKYEDFLRVEYTLHQVCSSIFVDQLWIEHLSSSYPDFLKALDFRLISPRAFQALRALCLLSNRTIYDSCTQFYLNKYVTASVVSKPMFESESESMIAQFRSSMTKTFSLSRSMIRDTTQVSGLLSALRSNYIITVAKSILIEPTTYNSCSCATSSVCAYISSIYNSADPVPVFNVSGFYTGCYVIESLLQSTLECFYDQQCIDKLQPHLSSLLTNVTALDPSLSKWYSPNTTIQELVDKLMIEQWDVSTTYEQYYNQCRPSQCSYTFETRNDAIYIVTTFFGIAGGLSTVLKFILPRLVKLVRKKRTQQRQVTGKTEAVHRRARDTNARSEKRKQAKPKINGVVEKSSYLALDIVRSLLLHHQKLFLVDKGTLYYDESTTQV